MHRFIRAVFRKGNKIMRIENYIPTGQYRYYYNVLSDGDKKAYDEMLCGLLNFRHLLDATVIIAMRMNYIIIFVTIFRSCFM